MLYELFPCLLPVMIVSWYQFTLFSRPELVEDTPLSDDNDFVNDLNAELDWWEYQEETWLAIGIAHLCSSIGVIP